MDLLALVLQEFKRLPLPGGAVVTQPGGRTLVNFDTIFYTTVAYQDFSITLLGQPVVIRATPAAYTWHFGDGNTMGPTDKKGAPYPSKEITHRYAQTGATFYPHVTVTYTGEFSIGGGPMTPIDGTVTIDGQTAQLTVVEARSELIAGS